MIDWFVDFLPLAASVSEDPGFLGSLFFKIVLGFRIALGIGLVIFVHELGHFVAAKTFGVKCEKFYVGFDVPIKIGPIKLPRTLGKFRYGETEYGIGVIPLGGYVKMLGQDDDPRNQESEAERIRVDGEEAPGESEPVLDPRSFPAKPVWQRMVIISAGVVMNVITGVLFAAIAYGYGISYNPAIVGGVTPGGPAWQAGIEPGGKVVSVGTWSDEDMHFREMRMEILTKGLEYPEEPINLAINYDGGVREFMLRTQPNPEQKDARMIGIAIPHSSELGKEMYAAPDSVAADVLTDEDAGAEVIAYDGTPINSDSIVPVTSLLNHLYTNPDKSVELRLKRVDGTEHDVTLPPQPAKSLGIQFEVGPIIALVSDGPAAKAGLQVDDRIIEVNGDASLDAYGLAQSLVGAKEPVKLSIERGVGDAAQEMEIEITPVDSPQTIPPTGSINGEIAINSVGFAYRPSPVIQSIDLSDAGDRSDVAAENDDTAGDDTASEVASSGLLAGDLLQWVRLETEVEIDESWEGDPVFASRLERLKERWDIEGYGDLNELREMIQWLPEGTPLKVAATRGTSQDVVQSTLKIQRGARNAYQRGLVLGPRTSMQQATSVSQALSLGLREGYRRFNDVIRFLKMIPRGQIKLRHVGGPLEIVNIAKNEAEKGIAPQLMFLTMLSMNLAILNFLPIPALDGGHMMFLIYELVAGKRANEQLEFRLTVAGLLTLLMLMAVVFANDILRHL